MMKRTRNDIEILDELVARRLTERWVELIADVQRDVAELLSDFDPMWSGNIFATLQEALIHKDCETVQNVLDRMYEFKDGLSGVIESLLDLRAAIKPFPEMYGGDNDD